MHRDLGLGAGRSIGIVGAGIVGASAALALARAGWDVTVFDPAPPGGAQAASYGNAGMVQTGTPAPMAAPGLLRALPRMLLDPESALVIRWRALPALAGWLARFVAAARPAQVEASSIHLATLLDRAGAAFERIAGQAGADGLIVRRGMTFVFRDQAARDAVAWEFDLFRRRGVTLQEMTGSELRDREPAIDPGYSHATHLPETFFSADPGALTAAIAKAAVAAGARLERVHVRRIGVEDDRPHVFADSGERFDFDRLVLSAGVLSRRFFADLGLKVPLETGRGYHVMLPRPQISINGPIVDAARHCGVVPMSAGVRVAGLMELAAYGAPPATARAARLADVARLIFPKLDTSNAEVWMGHRPITPDSLPVIGRAPRHPSILLGFGHGQLGFTMGPLTGELLADLAADRAPNIDLAPYRAERFG